MFSVLNKHKQLNLTDKSHCHYLGHGTSGPETDHKPCNLLCDPFHLENKYNLRADGNKEYFGVSLKRLRTCISSEKILIPFC